MRRRSRLWERGGGTIVLVAAVAAIAAACGTSNSAPCGAGDLLTCACLSGAAGTQTCSANGSYGPCTCETEGGAAEAGGGGHTDGGKNLPYMSPCTVVGTPGDCAPANGGECFDFPNRGDHCTHPCTANTDCALPSTGCNGMGVCKAPNATSDAGASDADAEAP